MYIVGIHFVSECHLLTLINIYYFYLYFFHFSGCIFLFGELDSSVSVVSGYGLDDRVIEVRFPAEASYFSFNLCVQTGFGAIQPPV
jgi:hypothetical protein